jgi:thiamine kinase-like enzyme
LSSIFGKPVGIVHVGALGEEPGRPADEGDLKGFGYGTPYLIVAEVGTKVKRFVLETMRPGGGFSHEHFSDRAGILLWQHSAFNKLPRHVRSVDVGAFTQRHDLKSLGDCGEFFIVTEFTEGQLYHEDLDRLKIRRDALPLDVTRCQVLSDYLAEIHAVKATNPALYVRRIRDLVGHGECIMGLTDSYPAGLSYASEADLAEVEKRCVEWRWKLKRFPHRLAQVHGDFHPWNVLFREAADFTVLDRSRGEWGEPADDVSSMTVNYLFYSLQAAGRLAAPFESLFHLFWTNYLDKTGDEEMLRVIQPFYVWRSLVVASPVWYPTLPEHVRVKLFNFVRNMLDTEEVDVKAVNSYFEP